MKEKITIGIFAHANAGKTTLTEQILFKSGSITNVGRVDHQNTTTDTLNVEKQRGITVRASLVQFYAGENCYNLIDTPGHIDFVAEVERSMAVLDVAVLVLSGVEGIEAQTYAIFEALKKNNIPTIIFINKLDRAGANFDNTFKMLKNNFKKEFIPYVEVDNQFNVKKLEDRKIFEKIALIDETCFETYSQGKLDKKQINKLFMESQFYPVFAGSALKGTGIEELFEFLKEINKLSHSGDLSAYVYQVRVENDIKCAYVKIWYGEIKKKQILSVDEEIIKIDSIFVAQKDKLIEVDNASAGDIAVIKGTNLKCGDCIGNLAKVRIIDFVKPLYDVALKFDETQSEKLIKALKELTIEDPYLAYRYNKESRQIQISVIGNVQAEVIKQLLFDRYNVSVEMENYSIIYKETPVSSARGMASFTSVSAVEFEITPLKRGEGIVYEDNIFQNNLLPKYLKQTKRLVFSYIKNCILGWELTDAKINLISGRYDSVGSEPMHYDIAVPIALFRALKNCKTKLLEPYNNFILSIPDNATKNVLSALSSLSAQVFETQNNDNNQVIVGKIPSKHISSLQKQILSLTAGLGVCTFTFDGYYETDNLIENKFRGTNPGNETYFVQVEKQQSIALLDKQPKRKHKVKYSKRRYDKNNI